MTDTNAVAVIETRESWISDRRVAVRREQAVRVTAKRILTYSSLYQYSRATGDRIGRYHGGKPSKVVAYRLAGDADWTRLAPLYSAEDA